MPPCSSSFTPPNYCQGAPFHRVNNRAVCTSHTILFSPLDFQTLFKYIQNQEELISAMRSNGPLTPSNSLFDKVRYMRRKHNYQTNVLKSKIDHCNYITKLKLLLKEWSKMHILRELHIFGSFNETEDSFIIEWEPYNSNPSLGTGLKVVGTCIFIGFESLERGT
jgi:hypothetical protein